MWNNIWNTNYDSHYANYINDQTISRSSPSPSPSTPSRFYNVLSAISSAVQNSNYSTRQQTPMQGILSIVSSVVQQSLRDLSTQIEQRVTDRIQEQYGSVEEDWEHLWNREHLRERELANYQYKRICISDTSQLQHESCSICFDAYEKDSIIAETSCQHYFHEPCIKRWLQTNLAQTCPICRAQIH